MSGKRMLPMGIENFERIRKDGFYYVDKTGFIREPSRVLPGHRIIG